MSEGQEAQVTFDAIEEGIFQGNVKKVGNTASASGGVARYSVEITIPKDEEMKAGMNASATNLSYLRKRLAAIGANVQIKATRNQGYSLEEAG